MSDSQLIPVSWINVSSGAPDELRPGSVWNSDPTDDQPKIVIELLNVPEPLVFVDDIVLSELANVDTYKVRYITQDIDMENPPDSVQVSYLSSFVISTCNMYRYTYKYIYLIIVKLHTSRCITAHSAHYCSQMGVL